MKTNLPVSVVGLLAALPFAACADIDFRGLDGAWCVGRGRAVDPACAKRQITSARDGIRVTMDAATSDLKPWSWGSINALGKVALGDAEDGSTLRLRFHCGGTPLVMNDVSIGIDDAAGRGVPWTRLPPGREGDVRVLSYRLDYSLLKNGRKPVPPFVLSFVNFGMECEKGEVTFMSLSVEPPRREERSAPSLAFDADTGNELHIVRTNLAERAVLVFSNVCDAVRTWKGEVVLSDQDGDVFVRRNVDFTLAPRQAFRDALPSPFPRMGVWTAHAELACGDGTKFDGRTTFAQLDHHVVTDKLPYGKFRLGLCYHMSSYGDRDRELTLSALTAVGAKIARVGGLWYYHYETEKGKPSWAFADRIVGELERRGIAICGGCYANPPWARKADGSRAPGFGPAAPGFQGAFLEKLARRYGERIDYYEIGNEWDLKPASEMTIEEGIAVTRECAEALKRGCPRARVLSSGWAVESSGHPMVSQKGFQERVMTACADVLDGHPIHVHGPWGMHVSRMREFFAMREKCGIRLPWFANETALTSVYGREVAVAKTIWRKIVWSWAHGSTDYLWYNLRAYPGNDENDAEQAYGLLTHDYRPRAGFVAFAALATLLEGFDFRDMREGDDGRAVYAFEGIRGGVREHVLVAWEALGGSGFSRRIGVAEGKARPAEAVTVDLYGNRKPLAIVGGKAVWKIGASPCALVVRFAERVEPFAENPPDVARVERRCLRCGEELALTDYALVEEIYQANPDLRHRLWKGPSDLSARVTFRAEDGKLTARASVRDDVAAAGDRFLLTVDGHVAELVRAGRSGDETAYRGEVRVPALPATVRVVVEDDDGEGVDVRISDEVKVVK